MKNILPTSLLLSLFTIFSINNLIAQDQTSSTFSEDMIENDLEEENDNDENNVEAEAIGHFISFQIDPSIIKDDNISIATEKNQFFLKIKLEKSNVIIFGKTDEESLILYNIIITDESSSEETLAAFDNAEKAFFSLEDQVDCEKIKAKINNETGELILFLPFCESN